MASDVFSGVQPDAVTRTLETLALAISTAAFSIFVRILMCEYGYHVCVRVLSVLILECMFVCVNITVYNVYEIVLL